MPGRTVRSKRSSSATKGLPKTPRIEARAAPEVRSTSAAPFIGGKRIALTFPRMSAETRPGDTAEAYDAFARSVVAGGIILDPWLDGAPRLSPEPLVLDAERARALARVGEDVAEL